MYLAWHAEHRPHQGLEGRTPKEVYDRVPAAERAKLKAKETPRSELIVDSEERDGAPRPLAPARVEGILPLF